MAMMQGVAVSMLAYYRYLKPTFHQSIRLVVRTGGYCAYRHCLPRMLVHSCELSVQNHWPV